jgi:hypothetical protein
MNRRLFFRALAAAGVFANIGSTARADGGVLARTPRDYEGPYYPVGSRNRTNDLIVGDVHDRVLNFSGQVVNTQGEPLANSLFDFWSNVNQANRIMSIQRDVYIRAFETHKRT